MLRGRHLVSVVAAVAAGVTLVGCAADDGALDSASDENNSTIDDDGEPGDGQVDNGHDDGAAVELFELDESQERADALIGLHEDELIENHATRIAARGEEGFGVSEDHVVGRATLTLDEIDGEWIVIHAEVETERGEPIVAGLEAADEDDPDPMEPGEAVLNEGFDADEAQARAEALIGTPEDDVVENVATRITHRGDEDIVVHADAISGRANLTVNEVDSDWIVTRVHIETPDGEAPIRAHLGAE